MKHLKEIVIRLCHHRGLKYGLVVMIALPLLGFIGENSLWNLLANKRRISELTDEIKQNTDHYEHDQMQIRQLESNPKAIRKIARERYFMKTDDEDIFVMTDDQPAQTTTNDNETTE